MWREGVKVEAGGQRLSMQHAFIEHLARPGSGALKKGKAVSQEQRGVVRGPEFLWRVQAEARSWRALDGKVRTGRFLLGVMEGCWKVLSSRLTGSNLRGESTPAAFRGQRPVSSSFITRLSTRTRGMAVPFGIPYAFWDPQTVVAPPWGTAGLKGGKEE